VREARELGNRLAELEGERQRLRAYMADKAKGGDWHGVADAANDLRELETEERVLRWVLEGR